MAFFRVTISLRMRKDILDLVDRQVETDPLGYENISHYIRSAINEKLKKDNPQGLENIYKKSRADFIK